MRRIQVDDDGTVRGFDGADMAVNFGRCAYFEAEMWLRNPLDYHRYQFDLLHGSVLEASRQRLQRFPSVKVSWRVKLVRWLLKSIVSCGDYSEYHAVFDEIVQAHHNCFSEDNFPTMQSDLHHFLNCSMRKLYYKHGCSFEPVYPEEDNK